MKIGFVDKIVFRLSICFFLTAYVASMNKTLALGKKKMSIPFLYCGCVRLNGVRRFATFQHFSHPLCFLFVSLRKESI